jgi:ABC-type uncharacterized transport system permease subunit
MALFYVAGSIAAIVVAWFASLIHASGHAPLGLVSLGVGAALGAAVCVIAANQRAARGKRLIIGIIMFAIVAVVAEHAWLYIDYRREWYDQSAKSPQVAVFQAEPLSPVEYFAHEWSPQNTALWSVDAALIIISAVATASILHRRKA